VNANGRIRYPEFLLGFFNPVLEKKIGKGRVRAERVQQYKEPAAFMCLFDGEIVIRSGQRSALRRKILRQDALFKVSVSRPGRAHIAQVSHKNPELVSTTSFVMQTETHMFLWKGAKASEDDVERGRNFIKKYSNDRPTVEEEEGSESSDFWDAAGGFPSKASDDSQKGIRLFRCSCDKGYFYVDRIRDFCQSDFDTASGFVLDGYDKVFLWVGNEASRTVEVNTTAFVKEFVASLSAQRNIDVAIEIQEVNNESIGFKHYFPAWEERVLGPAWEGKDPYDVSKKRITNLRNDDLLRRLREEKEVQQKAFIERIRKQSESGVKAQMVDIDFRKELEKAGIHLPDERTMRKKESAKTQQGWTKFQYHVKKGDEFPLAVQLVGSWDNFSEQVTMYPAPSPVGDPEKIIATFVTSLDISVGRYHYYYRVARESEGVVKDVDEEHAVSERKEKDDGKGKEEEGEEGEVEEGEEGEEAEGKIKMNSLRVRKEGRVNGEEEEREWDEKEKAKLESVLGVKEKFEEEKVEEEEEEEETKERKMRSLNEEEAELARQVEERLARRQEREEGKKKKEQEERRQRREEKEIEERIQQRRSSARGETTSERGNWRDRVHGEDSSSSGSSSARERRTQDRSPREEEEKEETFEERRERRRREREAASAGGDNLGDDLAERRRERRRGSASEEGGEGREGRRERRSAAAAEAEVDLSSMSIEERREYRRKRREGLL